MEEIENGNKNNTLLANEENKKDDNSSQSKSRNDNSSKNSYKTKKDILPQIRMSRKTNLPISSFNNKLKSSQSQKELFDNPKNMSYLNVNSIEKEKLMLAKLNLGRLRAKINDINYSYKKLLYEKEENINIIKKAISSNDYTYSENIIKKVEQMLEEAIYNKNNQNQNNQSKKEEDNNQKKITENQIKEDTSKENENKDINNEENKENENKDINNEENKENEKIENYNENNQDNNNNNQNNQNDNNENIQNKENENENVNGNNYNNEINGEINKENNENIDNNNINNDTTNQEIKHKNNYSMETRWEDPNNIKNNSFNNSRINNNSNIINSIEEENSIKEINDELNKYQIENGLFEKSVVSSKYYNILKAKAELATLKHKMIIIKQIISMKDEEINEIKNRAKMKNIIFQSNLLGKNMTELHKIKTKNKEIEDISIPSKNWQYENLKKKLEYYQKMNESALAESKNSNDNYISVKNEFDKKTKLVNSLEGKNSNLKYKLNTLRQSDFKKTMALKIMHQKIDQIPSIRDNIENQKVMISQKEKEINELKQNLNEKLAEYEKSSEKRNNGFEEMNKCERQLNYKISKQKNEFNKTRNEIREIDKLILKEIEIYENLNKNDQELVHRMYSKKNQDIKEYLNYLQLEGKNIEKKGEESINNDFKNSIISNKFEYKFISKIVKKDNNIKKKIIEEILPLLEDKLVY